ncbi:MAG: NAD(+)/NADH kinase [Chthoniobacteraceae bacterium]
MPARHLGLIANDSKPGARDLVATLVREFAAHPVQLHLDHRAARLLGMEKSASESELADRCELLIVLGGDGTILDVLHALGDTLRPLFGINLGTLGFLTTVGASELAHAVQAIVAGDYVLSERTLLKVEIMREGAAILSRNALNDAVASRGEISRLVRLNVRIGDTVLTQYNADGLIVATPTGSTAYSLSAGGPILEPGSGVFIVNPICPHVLTNRAVIVADSTPISITPADEAPDLILTLDGRVVQRIGRGDTIRITRAPQRLPLAMLPGVSFFDVLRQKLKWSGAAV